MTIIRNIAYNKIEVISVGLKEIRMARHMTQKELACQSGVNFRSLQDYEQGRKPLTSANGDVLLRLSTVLGCSAEDLLTPENMQGAELHEHNQLSPAVIQSQPLFCERYRIAGRWICAGGKISTFFYYGGQPYSLPFRALFTVNALPFLKRAAEIQMETKIDDLLAQKQGFESW